MTGKNVSSIDSKNFVLYYQPKINTKTNTIKSCEALIRLRADGKIIPPSLFIPQAEKDGSIVDIDRWVFERVAQDSRYISMKSQESIDISLFLSMYQENTSQMDI